MKILPAGRRWLRSKSELQKTRQGGTEKIQLKQLSMRPTSSLKRERYKGYFHGPLLSGSSPLIHYQRPSSFQERHRELLLLACYVCLYILWFYLLVTLGFYKKYKRQDRSVTDKLKNNIFHNHPWIEVCRSQHWPTLQIGNLESLQFI